MLERYTEKFISVLFFTLSGMHLNFSALWGAYGMVVLFVGLRIIGKAAGTAVGVFISGAPYKIKRYVALGLIPQSGIVIGLSLMIKSNRAFAQISDALLGIVIGATVIHEFSGSILSKTAIEKAGESHVPEV
jgi:Kef-type K+ transport system membrane component KefB